jgi:hypothetical protein
LAEEYSEEVAFIGVSDNRDTVEDGKDYADEFAVPYPLALEQNVWDAYGVPYQPVTVLLDAEGVEVHRVSGPISYEEFKAQIEGVLA